MVWRKLKNQSKTAGATLTVAPFLCLKTEFGEDEQVVIYRVVRTSDHHSKPCDDAFEGRTAYKKVTPKGTHVFVEKTWFIQFDSIEDLNKFIREHESVVILYDRDYVDFPFLLEIYDDYRE